jgi:diguanylate cyclase (GGDEF)-like protein
MGKMTGLELLAMVKQLDSDTQVVVMTSHASVEAAMQALRSGAYDFLIKPFEELDMITVVVNRAAEKVRLTHHNRRLVEDLQQQSQQLQQANVALKKLADSLKGVADKDGLTGLHNHRYFREVLVRELSMSSRSKRPFTLVFMDVDHFKHYNDTNGHLAGDALLKSLAELLQEGFGRSSLVARYGGEEIVALIPGVDGTQARGFAETIRKLVEHYPFPGSETQPLGHVTLSMGIASFPHDGVDPTTLIDAADKAVYEAKRQGRNRICSSQKTLSQSQ